MKPVRLNLVIACRRSLCCLQCGLALCLTSCATAPTRTASTRQEASPAATPATPPIVPVVSGGNSPDAASQSSEASEEQVADASQGTSAETAAKVSRRNAALPAKKLKDARIMRDDQVTVVNGQEVEAVPGGQNDKVPPPPPTASEAPGDGQDAAGEQKGVVNLNEAPLEEGDKAYPITLASAMKLSDARPLVIAAAQAGAWVAEAQLQRAKLIWVPQLNLGGDYIRHDGYGPDFNRSLNTAARPLSQNVNFLYSGGGLTAGFAMADAIYEPLAAKQVLKARRADIQTAKNDALLATAKAYFDVHQSRGQYAAALDVVNRGEKLVDRIGHLSEDLVPRVEVDRAKRQLANVQQNAAMARQKWRVTSADLTQVLRLDPRVVVEPAEHDHTQITLIDPARTLDDLIPIGLTNRPELASQQAIVGAVAERIRREKGKLLLPSVYLNGFQTPQEYLQFGVQGFGADGNLNLWAFRDDFSPQLLYQFEALGMGNLARIKEQRGDQSRAIVELFRVQDMVAADVTRAQARVQSSAVRTIQAERSLREALITYDGNYDGLRQTKRFENVLIQVYRPQEAVIALNDLVDAYDDYFVTVADYNRSQFEMYHALGYPALNITEFHPPGEEVPVDTSRPHFLPPVESGPPPATR